MASYLAQTYVNPLTADWQDEDFQSRKKITVNHEVVHATQTDIPVKVDFDYDDYALYFAMTKYHSGAMMRVYTSDGVECPCEAGVRMIDGMEYGQIRLFFLAPSLSSSADTVFYLYYGSKELLPVTYTDSDVWLPGHDGIWHDGYEVVGAYAKAQGRN